MNKRIVHDALILTAFTLVLGFILALVQGITADPIDIRQYFRMQNRLRNMIMMLMKLISLYLMRATRIQSMILRLPLIQTRRH